MKRNDDETLSSGVRPTVATRRFAGVQGLRAAAALFVVMEHLKNESARFFLDVEPAASGFSVFPYAAGVDVFFVISGFVIAYSSASLHGRAGAWKTFLVRRLARVVPLYWLMSATMLALLALGGSLARNIPDPGFVVRSFLFVPAVNAQGQILPLLSLGWTLNYEMLFYGVFALFVGLRARTCLLLVVATFLAMVLAGRLYRPTDVVLFYWSDPIILEFLAGIGLYGLVSRNVTLPIRARIGLVAVALGLLAQAVTPDIGLRWLVWGGPAVLLVLAAVTSDRPPRAGRYAKAFDVLGDTSYAIYLLHIFVLITLRMVLLKLGITGPLVGYVLFPISGLALTLAGALVLHLLFEKPVLRFLRRHLDTRPALDLPRSR